MARVLADSSALAAVARSAGHQVLAERVVGPAVRQAEALLLEGDDAWERLRGWRVGGVRAGAVIHTRSAPPVDRPRLEPVVLLRSVEREALERAIERLFDGRPAGTLELAGGRVDLDRGVFRTHSGEERKLSTQETRLLGYLGARSGRAIDREELQLQVWDHHRPIPSRSVDMAVSRLRKKLGDPPRRPRTLITVRHGGYRLLVTPREPSARLLGRDALLAQLREQLSREGFAVLTGPPGVGKSTLGREVASVRVDLEGVKTVAAAVSRIARATGIVVDPAASPEVALARLIEVPESQERCLLLDHVDRLPELPALLRVRTRGATRLVLTLRLCRQALPEVVLRVPPLEVEPAAELLMERCRRAGAEITLPQAHRLARLLDGLPLALELAAGRVATLGVVGLEHWLDSRLDVLGGGRDDRHATLRVALDGAWQDLQGAERRLLAGLSVFRGPFDLQAARAVVPSMAVDAWLSLTASGWIARSGHRFHLLHAIRDHANEAEPDAVRQAHRLHRGWLAEQARETLALAGRQGSRQAVDRLADRRSELEVALAEPLQPGTPRLWFQALDLLMLTWGTEAERLELAATVAPQLVTPVDRGWWLRSKGATLANRERHQALRLLDEAVELLIEADPDAAARAALDAARTARWVEGHQNALARLDRFEAVPVEPATRLSLDARALLARMATQQVGLREGTQRLLGIVEQLEVLGALGDAVRVAFMLPNRMRLLGLGDPLALVRRASTWAEALPDPTAWGQAAVSLAIELGSAGDLESSMAAFARAEELFGRAEPARRLQVLQQRSIVSYHCGELEEAEAGLERYVAWCTQQDFALGRADGLLYLASIACERGFPELGYRRAQDALGAAEKAGNEHLVHHARLAEGLATLLEGDLEGAALLLDQVDPSLLTSIGQHAWRTRRCAVARGLGRPDRGLEVQALEAARQEVGPYGPAVLAVVEAGLSNDTGTLALYCDRQRRGSMAAEVRLLAMAWALAASASQG